MNRIICCLLSVFLIWMPAQAAFTKPVRAISDAFAGQIIASAAPSSPDFEFRKQHSGRFRLTLRKFFAPDGPQGARSKKNLLAIAALFCGILGVLLSGVGVGLLFSSAAVAMSIAVLHKKSGYQGFAIAGLILGVTGIVIIMATLLLAGPIW